MKTTDETPRSLETMFLKAKQHIETQAATSLLSERDITRLLAKTSSHATIQKRSFWEKFSLSIFSLARAPQYRIISAWSLALVILLAIFGSVFLYHHEKPIEALTLQTIPPQTDLSRTAHGLSPKQTTSTKPEHVVSIAAKPSTPQRIKNIRTIRAAQNSKFLSTTQDFVWLSEDTPAYNPEQTISEEVRLMRALQEYSKPTSEIIEPQKLIYQ